ncbi:hypothetical protein JR316_0013420 [Psilocybe cubensis]|uniref:Uncharacterized protein n=2 Tax=Psilocybe cubensis TaxID=181762 RepID=A0A8H8CDR4_PSICU|nr:uncharacterized protein JR316_0013420 [Psilocybe cubensis]KAH9474257.1 hypothetical protein JR316_0013420 [Psilocybe cubensis]
MWHLAVASVDTSHTPGNCQINDTVTFVFDPESIHTVTESSLENPCSPLPGGFSSGTVNGAVEINETLYIVKWDLQISNISTIWFFCENTDTQSHCVDSGMVGAINPPSIDAYTKFQKAAKKVKGTPKPSFQIALTGLGAFATQTPAPVSTPTSISLPTSTSQHSAITGGAVGAAIVIVLGLVGILWHLRVQRLRRNGKTQGSSSTSEDDDFFRYDPRAVRRQRPSVVFAEEKQLEVARSLNAAQHSTPVRTLSTRPAPPITSNHSVKVPTESHLPRVPQMQNPKTLIGLPAKSLNGNSSTP